MPYFSSGFKMFEAGPGFSPQFSTLHGWSVASFFYLFLSCFYYLGFLLLFLLWLLMWVLNDLWILEGMVELVNVCEIWECGFVHFLGSCKVQKFQYYLLFHCWECVRKQKNMENGIFSLSKCSTWSNKNKWSIWLTLLRLGSYIE